MARATLVAAAVALGACTSTPPPAAPLDAAAEGACDALAPIAADVRAGAIEGRELYRVLQDVWNLAQRAENAPVRENAQALLTAAINNDREALSTSLTALQQACNLPFQ